MSYPHKDDGETPVEFNSGFFSSAKDTVLFVNRTNIVGWIVGSCFGGYEKTGKGPGTGFFEKCKTWAKDGQRPLFLIWSLDGDKTCNQLVTNLNWFQKTAYPGMEIRNMICGFFRGNDEETQKAWKFIVDNSGVDVQKSYMCMWCEKNGQSFFRCCELFQYGTPDAQGSETKSKDWFFGKIDGWLEEFGKWQEDVGFRVIPYRSYTWNYSVNGIRYSQAVTDRHSLGEYVTNLDAFLKSAEQQKISLFVISTFDACQTCKAGVSEFNNWYTNYGIIPNMKTAVLYFHSLDDIGGYCMRAFRSNGKNVVGGKWPDRQTRQYDDLPLMPMSDLGGDFKVFDEMFFSSAEKKLTNFPFLVTYDTTPGSRASNRMYAGWLPVSQGAGYFVDENGETYSYTRTERSLVMVGLARGMVTVPPKSYLGGDFYDRSGNAIDSSKTQYWKWRDNYWYRDMGDYRVQDYTRLSPDDPVQVGEWNLNLQKCVKYGQDNDIPVFALWRDNICGNCNAWDLSFSTDTFRNWMYSNEKAQIIWCIMWGAPPDPPWEMPDQENSITYNWMWGGSRSGWKQTESDDFAWSGDLIYYPFGAIYWRGGRIDSHFEMNEVSNGGNIEGRAKNLIQLITEKLKNYTPHEITQNYTVTFTDYDGTVLKTQSVQKGCDATPPSDPVRTGYSFSGWEPTYKNITEDTVCTAQYKRKSVEKIRSVTVVNRDTTLYQYPS